MKVTEIINEADEYGDGGSITILINDKHRFSIGSGEPEDMTLSRDLSDVFNIVGMLNDAFNAGAGGDRLFINNIKETE